jgi:ferrochelatase
MALIRAMSNIRREYRMRTGILYCNLGTPDEPTPAALRRYLREFLSDPRVVEIPRAAWLPILYGLVLPLRAPRSAAKYASIWTPEGSPLALWTRKQALLLQGWLGEHGHRVAVRHAMRYGSPSIASQLDALKADGVTRILVITAYPQYSATSTASVIDAVNAWSVRQRAVPELRFVNRYHDDAGYVEAIVRKIEREWREHGRADHLVMSFHGIPERAVRLGDPYRDECMETAQRVANRLGLPAERFTVSFQSRFGRARWLEPATDLTLRSLGKRGVARVDVVCPGFVADCLETLEEIAMEGRRAFLTAGGKEFRYIACLNDDPQFVGALGGIVQGNLRGWPS